MGRTVHTSPSVGAEQGTTQSQGGVCALLGDMEKTVGKVSELRDDEGYKQCDYNADVY